jgi:THO complex subunit 4
MTILIFPFSHPKSKPKPVSAAKTDRKRDSRGRGARRGRAGGRPKPKTAEQLDAEMADYFTETTTTAPAQSNGGAVPAPANEDMGMDEI